MQYNEFRSRAKKCVYIGLVILLSVFLVSCASKRAAPQDVAGEGAGEDIGESKMITDIRTEDGPDSVSVSIDGNQLLTYTSVKQPLPMGLVLYFPETSLSMGQTEFEANSDVIGSIKAAELIEDGPSKITIAMKVDAAYQITREGNGLKVTFSKLSTGEDNTQQEMSDEMTAVEPLLSEETAEGEGAGETVETQSEIFEAGGEVTGDMAAAAVEAPAAETSTTDLIPAAIPASEPEVPETVSGENMLQAIKTDYHDTSMDVIIQLDRMARDYKKFTLKNPARIVIDLYGVKSKYKGQQTIPVGSQWVKQVRHFAYPDKVRVVVDIEDAYLASNAANPSKEGLKVQVGEFETVADTGGVEEPARSTEIAPTPVPVAPEPQLTGAMETPEVSQPQASYASISGPALVNRIDFLSQDRGKSSIVIGTTRPIQYNLDGTDDRKLRLELFDTKIMSYRQRPLITTRFESAVDRIIPVQTEKMGNTSRVVIELREAVAYQVNQTDSQITIDFSASSIAPKPFEEANLPPWKTVMEEEAKVAEMKLAAAETSEPAAETPQPAPPVSGIAEPETAIPAEPVIAPDLTESQETLDIAGLDTSISDALAEKEDIPLPEGAEDFAVEDQKPGGEAKKVTGPKKRYTGEKIALDFYQTDIKNVLRILRDVSGRNFAIDKDVSGSVTLTLVKPVPWDQVLDLILRMNGLGQISEGEIVRIVTVSTLAKEEQRRADELKAKQSIKKQEKALEPLFTEYIPINYADATADIKPRLDEVITPERGNVGVDTRNNQIILTDTAEKIQEAKKLIRTIDKVTPQVIIEARVVEVSEDFTRRLGTSWDMAYGPVTQGDISHTYSIAMDHGVSPTGTLGYTFGRIGSTPVTLDATLQAAETTGDGKIISTPKIVTLDNKAATISQGIDYPYFEKDSTGGGTSVKFKPVNLSLNVTPHVTPDNRVSLKIQVAKNDIASFTEGVPAVTTNSANTELLVNDGDTVVIGGVMKTSKTTGSSRIPMLHKIPILGWLFKSKNIGKTKSELLIFITPKIVHLEASA